MSEAELHLLRARLQGGILAKASRGELELALPVGLVYTPEGRIALEPDQQVQGALRTFFETFRRTGSASATVRAFREQACSSRVACAPALTKESWSGRHFSTGARYACSTTRGTPAPSSSDVPAHGRRPTGLAA